MPNRPSQTEFEHDQLADPSIGRPRTSHPAPDEEREENVPTGVAEIDIATGRTVREEHDRPADLHPMEPPEPR